MFLPDDPSYQEIWLKPQQITLAYVQVLQCWLEEANLLAPCESHPSVMSVRELRLCIGKYTTFNEYDVFKGLRNALSKAEDEDMGTPPADSTTSPAITDAKDTQPSHTGTPLADSTASSAMTDIEDTQLSPTETQSVDNPIPPSPVFKSEAKDEDTGTPPADSTASPAMTDAKDTQPSPVETPPADDTTVLAAKPDAGIQKDLPATWGASPARLEDPVAPTAVLMDKLAGPPTPANHMAREGQEYLQWIKVHSSQKVAAVGSVPYKSGEPQWYHNCSSKWCKRVQHLLEEE